MTLTVRSATVTGATTKGSALTHAEMDANWAHVTSFTQLGAGAATRTVPAKLRDVVHIKDYGADCGGVVDDTTAITNALASVTSGGTIYYSGTPLVSSKITITKRIRLIADGSLGIINTSRPVSYFIKKSTMTTAAIEFSGTSSGASMEGGGVVAQGGNTGPNIVLTANSVSMRDVYSEGAGSYGFYLDGLSNNANHWKLDNCRAYSNGSHGFYFDGASGTGNANAGTALNCAAQLNAGDGFNSNYAFWNVFEGCSGDTNTGYGIRFQNGQDNALLGGDFEANTAGQIRVDSGERKLAIIQKNNGFAITDNGYYTRRLDRAVSAEFAFTPAIRGSTGATKAVTGITVVGTTATVAAVGHGYSNGDTVLHGAFVSPNITGAFVIGNVTANAYDVTVRTDRAFAAPVTGSETATAQKCGVYSVQVGQYRVNDGWVEFAARITLSSVTNITGTTQFVLPLPSRNINANLFCNAQISYYTGITHTAKLEIVINNNSTTATFYAAIGGAPGAAAQFDAAGLAATADMIITGRYFIALEN